VSRRLLFVRHGVTSWNREGRFQGHLDPSLSPEGEAEARLVAERLTGDGALRPARLISSPLARARQTAEAIVAALGEEELELELDPRLMEVGQGEWEGRTHAELAVEDAERYDAWRRARWDRQPPGGEPVEAAVARIRSALEEAILSTDRASAWPLCITAHGGTLRLAAHALLEIPVERAWRLEFDNAALSLMDQVNGRWRLVTWNDGSHLLGRTPVHIDEDDGQPLAL
jgi:broad specificity phosphatase PhoE